jgi:ABC-2 type transport system permease protein
VTTLPEPSRERHPAPRWLAPAWTFTTILRRDIVVAAKLWPMLLAQAVLLPGGVLFVLGRLLVDLGYVSGDYARVLLPGIVAANAFLGGLQGTATPMVLALHATGDLEDILLAPVSHTLVAVGKVVSGALRGLAGALVLAPLGFLVVGEVHRPDTGYADLAAAAGVLVLGALTGSSIGLCLATLVPVKRYLLSHAVAIPLLVLTGAVPVPVALLGSLPAVQVVCALNPLTYVSEGLRAALLGAMLPSVSLLVDAGVLVLMLGGAGLAGLAGFRRRTLCPRLTGPPRPRSR